MSNKPVVCRPAAYYLFASQIPLLHTTDGLWRAATAIAMHALDDVSPDEIERRFDALAQRVRDGSPSGNPMARVAHLHHVLFETDGYAGNFDSYYSPLNSYLPAVLEGRLGLPIVLALIYKVVGERVGLQVEGINSPGHFLVRVQAQDRWMIIDPFFHGQMLNEDEALLRLTELTGQNLVGQDECLQVATHQQWITRILTNLQNVFASEGRQNDLAAMRELQKLLWDSV